MENLISAIIGAVAAVIVALINNKRNEKKRDSQVERLIKQLNIHGDNVYVIDSSTGNHFDHVVRGSKSNIIYIIK